VHPYSQEAHKAIDDFIHTTYRYAPPGFIDYRYLWHGLMGYTQNGVRLIGPEPANKTLLYNLGCNGVGILPSIYGGKKISQILNGEQLEESIFDPHIEKVD
jgi:glycine/D-amino acid oxidase-like deaminating enzyme